VGRRFAADGSLLDFSEFLVNAHATQDQMEPDVALAPGGEFVVVWRGVGAGSSFGYPWFRRYAADETLTALDAAEVKISPGIDSANEPAVARDHDGEFVVVWATCFIPGGAGSDIGLRRFDANRVALADVELVNSTVADVQRNPALAMDSAGNSLVPWEQGTFTGELPGQRFLADGTREGGEFVLTTAADGIKQTESAVAASPAGDFLVAWAKEGADGAGYGIVGRRTTRPTIPVGGACDLIEAIESANGGAVTDCVAGNGGSIVTLSEATFTISAPYDATNALPVVRRPVTLVGAAGGSPIERDPNLGCPAASESDEFPLFSVVQNGGLDLDRISVESGCQVTNGSDAAGIDVGLGGLRMTESVVSSNVAAQGVTGDVKSNSGTLLLLDSEISDNASDTGTGGIRPSLGLTYFERTTVAGNTGSGVRSGGPLLVHNSTIADNSAAGVATVTGRTAIEHTTVAGNGVGIDLASPSLPNRETPSPSEVTIRNSLVGDSSGQDCIAGGTLQASGTNLDTDGSCAAIDPAIDTVAALELEALAQGAGFGRTRAPGPTSPALDAVAAGDCTFSDGSPGAKDQNRNGRVDDDGDLVVECEAGSVERRGLFADDFESRGVGRWSAAVGAS
jgi:hypothetical protein